MAELISNAAKKQGTPVQENDVIVVTHVVVSKAEGNIINLDEVNLLRKRKKLRNKQTKTPP